MLAILDGLLGQVLKDTPQPFLLLCARLCNLSFFFSFLFVSFVSGETKQHKAHHTLSLSLPVFQDSVIYIQGPHQSFAITTPAEGLFLNSRTNQPRP